MNQICCFLHDYNKDFVFFTTLVTLLFFTILFSLPLHVELGQVISVRTFFRKKVPHRYCLDVYLLYLEYYVVELDCWIHVCESNQIFFISLQYPFHQNLHLLSHRTPSDMCHIPTLNSVLTSSYTSFRNSNNSTTSRQVCKILLPVQILLNSADLLPLGYFSQKKVPFNQNILTIINNPELNLIKFNLNTNFI